MTEYKIAVALEEKRCHALKARIHGRWLTKPELKTRLETTPDDNYVIVTGEWIGLGDPEYADFLRAIENQRHAIVTISDEGEIWLNVVTEDADGCDEAFSYILGWSASICLWEDTSQMLV